MQKCFKCLEEIMHCCYSINSSSFVTGERFNDHPLMILCSAVFTDHPRGGPFGHIFVTLII